MLEYIESSHRHAESHEKGPDVVKMLKNASISTAAWAVSAPLPRRRGLQVLCHLLKHTIDACFSAIAPEKGTARLRVMVQTEWRAMFQRHCPGEGDCKGDYLFPGARGCLVSAPLPRRRG